MGQNGFGDDGSGYAWWAAFLARAADDRALRLRDPRGHRRPQRAPGAGAAAIGLTLTMIHFVVDPCHRHLGQPGPLHRRRRSSPAATRSSSSGCSSWRRWSARAIGGFTYPLLFGHGTDPVARLRAELRPARRPPRCPATARPTSSSRSGTSSDRARTRPRGSRSRSSRTAGSGTTPRRSGSRSEQWQPAPPAQATPADGRPGAPPGDRPGGRAAGEQPPTQPEPAPAAPRSARRSELARARSRSSHQRRAGPVGRDLLDQADAARVERPRRRRPARAGCWCRARPGRRTCPAGVVHGLVDASRPSRARPPRPSSYAVRQPSPSRGRRRHRQPGLGAVLAGPPLALAAEPPDVAAPVLGVVVDDLDRRSARCRLTAVVATPATVSASVRAR